MHPYPRFSLDPFMPRRFSVALLFVFVLLAGACSQPKTPEERADVIASIVNQARSESDVPGASVAVVRGDTVLHQSTYGVADRATERPVTDSTIFQLASATKIFAGVGVMMLVEEGRLALDDSVHAHLPALPDAWRGVTVRRAMSHTSGLPSLIDPRTGDLVGGSTMAEAWRAAQQKPLRDTSTTTWRYNQTGFEVVRRVVERVSGRSWEAFARERIFGPAGMRSTVFLGAPVPDSSRLATPYREGGEAFDFSTAYEYYVPTAAGLFSTTGDLTRFVRALSAGRLLGAAARETMWTSVPFEETTIDAVQGYGIGWTVDAQDGHRRVWHSGGGKAVLMHYPDEDLTVILLTNRVGFDVLTPTTEIAELYL
jgi:CubicO group peptidase (beta-lactamase class C family)